MIIATHDKKLHFAYGAATFLVGAYASVLVGVFLLHFTLPLAALVGVLAGGLAATAAGWGKERYDARHADVHTAEQMDAVATMGGGLLGAVLFTATLLAAVFA